MLLCCFQIIEPKEALLTIPDSTIDLIYAGGHFPDAPSLTTIIRKCCKSCSCPL